MAEVSDAILASYDEPTHDEQLVLLAFLITDRLKWLRRRSSWADYFDGDRELLWRGIHACSGQVTRLELSYRLEQQVSQKEQFDTLMALHDSLAETREHLGAESFDGVLAVLESERKRRLMLSTAGMVLANVRNTDPDVLLAEARGALLRAHGAKVERSDLLDPAQMDMRLQRMRESQNKRRFWVGIPELDMDLGGGFLYGDFIVMIAPTNSGKSFFLGQCAWCGLQQGARIAYFQGEMNLEQSDMRLDTRMAYTQFSSLRSGMISDQEVRDWFATASKFRKIGGSVHTFYMGRKDFTPEGVEARGWRAAVTRREADGDRRCSQRPVE
jgi:hypothetical protein